MSGSGRKVFAAGEVLRAADVDNYLMDQSVMRFAGTAARGSAIGTAVSEGMVSYLDDLNQIQVYDGSAWQKVYPAVPLTGQIVQVVSVTKSDTASTNSISFIDLPGLSLSITPSSTSSKILTVMTIGVSGINTVGVAAQFNLVRNSTTIAQPSGGAQPASIQQYTNSTTINMPVTLTYLDSPSTTSAVTYKYQYKVNNASGTMYINRLQADAAYTGVATLTAFEVL